MGGQCIARLYRGAHLSIGAYIIENGATVRDTARVFKISKSTVHKDVSERLLLLNPGMAAQVRRVLDVNKAERHIRGGQATYRKYKCHDEEC